MKIPETVWIWYGRTAAASGRSLPLVCLLSTNAFGYQKAPINCALPIVEDL